MTTVQHESEEYNGWPNRETWLVALWLNNDMSSYETLVHIATGPVLGCDTVYHRSQTLRKYVEEGNPLHITPPGLHHDLIRNALAITPTGLYHDLLNGALAKVDWYQIIRSVREDFDADGIQQ